MNDYNINNLNTRLIYLQDKIRQYSSFIEVNHYHDVIDFDCLKKIDMLILKSKNIDISNIKDNPDSFYFLIDLWEKDLAEIEEYFLENNIKVDHILH